MKSLIISVLFGISFLFFSEELMAQRTTLTLEVKGVKDTKGELLIAVIDPANPQNVLYDKIGITGKKELLYIMENLNPGEVDVSVFHDLNGNYQLDLDENRTPVEPCFRKEGVKIGEGENKLTVKLVNVKELMSR